MIKTQPLKYHGGKSYLAKWIHSLAPPSVIDDPKNGYTHRNIAFAGGLGEFWNWLPIEGISEAVNDLNGDISGLYVVLRDDAAFAEFRRAVDATPFSSPAFDNAAARSETRRLFPVSSLSGLVPSAVDFFIRYRMSRQGLGKDYATPTTRVRRGMNENVSAYLSAVDGLPECHARLRRVEIRNMDAIEFIAKYDHPRALFYLDPPYLHETRKTTGEYEHEMKDPQHVLLLESLSRIQGKFMLSGYHSTIYDEAAGEFGWNLHEKQIDNKASSKKSKEKKIECLWTNY